MGQWIVGVISFQNIFGLSGLKGHEYSGDKVGCHACSRTTKCEDRARILKQNLQLQFSNTHDGVKILSLTIS